MPSVLVKNTPGDKNGLISVDEENGSKKYRSKCRPLTIVIPIERIMKPIFVMDFSMHDLDRFRISNH